MKQSALINVTAPRGIPIGLTITHRTNDHIVLQNRSGYSFKIRKPKNDTWLNVDMKPGTNITVVFEDYNTNGKRYTRLNLV